MVAWFRFFSVLIFSRTDFSYFAPINHPCFNSPWPKQPFLHNIFYDNMIICRTFTPNSLAKKLFLVKWFVACCLISTDCWLILLSYSLTLTIWLHYLHNNCPTMLHGDKSYLKATLTRGLLELQNRLIELYTGQSLSLTHTLTHSSYSHTDFRTLTIHSVSHHNSFIHSLTHSPIHSTTH